MQMPDLAMLGEESRDAGLSQIELDRSVTRLREVDLAAEPKVDRAGIERRARRIVAKQWFYGKKALGKGLENGDVAEDHC